MKRWGRRLGVLVGWSIGIAGGLMILLGAARMAAIFLESFRTGVLISSFRAGILMSSEFQSGGILFIGGMASAVAGHLVIRFWART